MGGQATEGGGAAPTSTVSPLPSTVRSGCATIVDWKRALPRVARKTIFSSTGRFSRVTIPVSTPSIDDVPDDAPNSESVMSSCICGAFPDFSERDSRPRCAE